MPTFAYSAVDTAGKRRNGLIEAVSESAAVSMVAAEGRYITEIKESDEKAEHQAKTKDGERRRSKATRADLALFTRRLSDLTSAGLPLDRVLSVLAEQSESAPLSEAAWAALEQVRGGLSVSDSLAMHPKLFPVVYTQTLKAGEASGQFADASEKLADLLENEVTRRSQVTSALVYPAVLTGVAIFVVVFLLTFVVPRLTVVFEGLGDNLFPTTKILLAVTGFITENWLLIIGSIVGAVLFYRVWSRTESGAMARDKMLMKMPMAGSLIQKGLVSRYARVLGTLLNGGVPILEALQLSGLATGNRVFSGTSEQVIEEVREGQRIAQAMTNTGAFPPVLTHMVAIGEETGDLPKMLRRVSSSLDFEVDQGLRRLTSALEPLIVLVMGAFVAFVVLSVMLPIFQAQDLVK